jgi:hypothetical protein
VRRVTVGFRIILAIPHLLYLVLLSIVGTFAAVAAWVAAVVTGRMPDGLGDFLGRIVQYATRVNAYVYLLTDKYPPFSLDDTSYPVSVLLPPRGRLNRAAVLFRLVLAIPAGLLFQLVSSGVQPAMVLIWLIVLVAGRMPTPAFEAVAAFLRFETRLYAWLLMLTSEYPGGLFGDQPSTASPDGPGPEPAPAAMQAAPTAPSLPPPPPPPLPPPPTAGPRITRLVLSKAGKRLLVVFIVLGSVLTVAQIALAIASSGQSERALRDVDREYAEVVRSSQEYGATTQGCGLSGGPACVQAANADFARAMREFRADLVEVEFPEYALSVAEDLRDDADQLIALLDQMALTTDPETYERLALQSQVVVNQMDSDYFELRELLRFGF